MTYLQILNLIKDTALAQPNVNSVVREFLDLNREDAKYSAVVIQDRDGSRDRIVEQDYVTYTWHLGYVDRLTYDESNRDDIISTGINIINNIVNTIRNNWFPELEVSIVDRINTFDQRFTAQCAGVYVVLAVNAQVSDCVDSESTDLYDTYDAKITENGVYHFVPSGRPVDEINITVDVAGKEEVSLTDTVTMNGIHTYIPEKDTVYKDVELTVDVHPTERLVETYTTNGVKTITGEFNGGEITVDVDTDTVWGKITGNITDQTDLVDYVTGKDNEIKTWVESQSYISQIKTVNSQSLIGEGNIDISGMTPEQEAAIDPLMNPEEGIIVHTVYKPNVLVENKDLDLSYQWAGHQSEIDGDFYCINNGDIFKFNKKTYIYEKLNDNYIETYGNYNLWKDNSGRYYLGNQYQIDMNTLQLTSVDFQMNYYTFSDPGNRSNIWKGQYGIYQLSNIPQKFDENNQRFVDWPNVNITEGYDLGNIAPYFGVQSFTYEGHIIMVYDDGSMWEMTEYEDHIDIDKVDNPYFPMEYNGNQLQNGKRYLITNGILYYFGSNVSKPLKLVNGNWVEFSIYREDGYEYTYNNGYYPGIFCGDILLGGNLFQFEGYFSFINLSSKNIEYTIWQNLNTVAVDLKSNQKIRGLKNFESAYIDSLNIHRIFPLYENTTFDLNRNHTTAKSIKITSPIVTVNNKPIADKTDVILNSTELPYGYLTSEDIYLENFDIFQDKHFRTHTGRWITYYNGGYYEFNGTGFQLVKSDVPYMNNYNNSYVVVTPNMTFYNLNDYTYIWDDINSTFIQVCNNLGIENWAYWWDGTNLRHKGDYKLVNTNDTWEWVEDTINDYISGMYHYVNSRVIILTLNDTRVLEYNPSNKTYTQLGHYTPWTDTSFTVGNDILWPWNGEEYRVLDLSKVTQEGDTYIDKSTSIPWSDNSYVHIEFQGHLWYGIGGYTYRYCYDINYEKPVLPATDGEYVLTGTRGGNSVTYSWKTPQSGGSTPDLSSYATKTWVTEQGFLREHQDLTGYATKTWVTEQGYLTEHQDLSSYALKSDIPSLDGYATQDWVNNQLSNYTTNSDFTSLQNRVVTLETNYGDALNITNQILG